MFKFKSKIGFYGFWLSCLAIIFAICVPLFIVLPNMFLALFLKTILTSKVLLVITIVATTVLGSYLCNKIGGKFASYFWDKSIILGKE